MGLLERKSFLFLLLFQLLLFGFIVWTNRGVYLKKFDPVSAKIRYEESQFVADPNKRSIVIEDDEVYAWAGYNYINYLDPTKINFEHPPLGKIFVGVSIKFFGNPAVVQIFWGAALLFILYFLSLRVLNSKSIALIPGILLTCEPLFVDQIKFALLDLPQVFFMIAALYLSIKEKITQKDIVLVGLCLGAATAIKFFASGLLFAIFIFGFLFFVRKIKVKNILLSFILMVFVYGVSYYGFFLSGHSLIDFGKLHYYVLKYYRSFIPNYPPFEIWRIIAVGQWRTWFGNSPFIPAPDWWIGWPIAVGLSFFALFDRRLTIAKKLPLFWLALYLVSNSFHVVFSRYLLAILPIAYVYLIYMLGRLI